MQSTDDNNKFGFAYGNGFKNWVQGTSRVMPRYEPKGKLCLLQPKHTEIKKVPEHKRIKPPRFIPFEPYSCSVSFIETSNKNKKKKFLNHFNKSSNSPVSKNDLNSAEQSDKSSSTNEPENETVKCLRKERDYFKSQLKAQTFINKEIKSLLIAVIGEDFHNKMEYLKEDKLRLTRVLLDSMNDLSTHSEEVEFLNSQCEVWRSKFLASSVIISQLEDWKKDLKQKNELLINNNLALIKLIENLRLNQIQILKNLIFLSGQKTINISAVDVITLTTEILNMTQQMVLNSNFGGVPRELEIHNLNQYTDIEKTCLETINNAIYRLTDTDDAFKAIIQQAKTENC